MTDPVTDCVNSPRDEHKEHWTEMPLHLVERTRDSYDRLARWSSGFHAFSWPPRDGGAVTTLSRCRHRAWTICAFGRSRPAADASREVVERWLLDGVDVYRTRAELSAPVHSSARTRIR